MATISRLLVAIGADTSGLRSGLSRATTHLTQFAKEVQGRQVDLTRVFGDPTKLTQAGAQAGAAIAHATLESATKVFTSRDAARREALANKMISVDAFHKIGRQAANTFDKALLDTMNTLRSQGLLTPQIIAGMSSQFKNLGDKLGKDMHDRISAQLGQLEQLGGTMTRALTLPIAVGLTGIAKSAGDFEGAMNALRGPTEATAGQLVRLNQAARSSENVRRYGFTAVDAAKGMQVLAVAGLKTESIISALGPLLKIAAVEQIQVADAASTVINVMTSFGFQANEAGRVMDVLALASVRGKVTLTDLGRSLTYAGSIAKSMGLNFEEVVAALTLMGDAGFKATLGGTSLRGALARMTSPTKKQAAIFKELGVQTLGVGDQLLDLDLIFAQVLASANKLGTFKVATKLFEALGQRAGPGIQGLVGQLKSVGEVEGELTGPVNKLRELTNELKNSQGQLTKLANFQATGLNAEIKTLKAEFVELAIAIGESGFLKSLSDFVRGLTLMIKSMSGTDKTILKIVTYIALFTATLGPAISGAAKFGFAIRMLMGAGSTGLRAFAILLGPGAAIIVGLGLLVAAFTLIGKKARDARRDIEEFQAKLIGMSSAQLRAEKASVTSAIILERNKLHALQDQQDVLREQIRNPPKDSTWGTRAEVQRQYRENALAIKKITDLRTGSLTQLTRKSAEVVQQLGQVTRTELANADDMAAQTQSIADRLAAAGAHFAEYNGYNSRSSKEAETALESFRRRVQDIVQYIRNIPEVAFGDPTAQMFLNLKAGEQAKDIIAEINKYIKDNNLSFQQALDYWIEIGKASKAHRDTLIEIKGISDQSVNLSLTADFESLFRALQNALNKVSDFENRLTIARSAGDRAGAGILRKEIEKASGELFEIQTALFNLISGSTLPSNIRAQLLERIAKMFQEAGLAAGGAVKPASKFMNTLSRTAKIAAGLRDIADAFGGAGRNVGDMLDGVVGVVEGVKEIKKVMESTEGFDFTAFAQGVAGIVSGAVGVLGSLFGQSEHDRILQDNNRELRRVAAGLENFVVNANVLTKAFTVARNTDIQKVFDAIAGAGAFTSGNVQFEILDNILDDFGLNMEQLSEIAEQHGITLLMENGELAAGTLAALGERLGYAIDQLTKWGASLEDQRRRLEVKDILFDNTSPVAAAQRELDLIKQFSPRLFEQFLAGFDVNTVAGREAITKGLQDIFTLVDTGKLDAALLDGFANITDLMDALVNVKNGMNEVAEATNQVVGELLNIPTGFKIGGLAWRAALPGMPGVEPTRPLYTPPSPIPFDPGNKGPIVINGDINIDGGAKDPGELWDEMLDSARKKAYVKYGNPNRWKEL